MSQFRVYQDYCLDATLVSNTFIDNYMGEANDAQIKIYLYLLRVLCAHKSCSVSDLADQFNYTEKDVQRALKYWEKKNLLSLEYDENKLLCGVRLLDLNETPNAPLELTLAPVVQLPVSKVKYSLDDIKEYKDKDQTDELIFVVEQYLGRTLSPTDIRTLMFFEKELGFSNELIDYLFEYCVNKGKKDIRYIEKVALSWHEEGITTPKMAAKASKKYDKEVYDIMKSLGKSTAPTRIEADYITKWTKDYDYSFDIIEEACNRTVMATDTHRFEYADKILSNWKDLGVHHLSDVNSLDSKYTYNQKRKVSQGTLNQKNVPQYKQFTHASSDYDDLEKELLSN